MTQGLNAARKAVVPLADGVVAVAHPQLGHDVEQVFGRIRGVDVGSAGIRPHAQQGKTAGRFELGIQGELVIHLGDAVRVGTRACKVDVIAAGLQAGAHHIDVGRGKSRVQDKGDAEVAERTDDCRAIAGVEADRRDPWIVEPVRKEGSAGGHRVGDDELLEHRFLHEFQGGHGPHRAGTQHQDFHKLLFSLLARHSVWPRRRTLPPARPRPRR